MFKKTILMNRIAAVGWAFVGIALLFNKSSSVSSGTLTAIVVLYAAIVAVPAFTARALSGSGGPQLRRAMIVGNGAFIAVWVVSAIGMGLMSPTFNVGSALLSACAFVIPEAINISALMSPNAAPPTTATNQTAHPDPKITTSHATEGRAMKVSIVDRSSTKTIYTTEIHLSGANYRPGNEERFDLAWRSAVEDGAVKAEDRARYAFIAVDQPPAGG